MTSIVNQHWVVEPLDSLHFKRTFTYLLAHVETFLNASDM
jgi:hypothetical protein